MKVQIITAAIGCATALVFPASAVAQRGGAIGGHGGGRGGTGIRSAPPSTPEPRPLLFSRPMMPWVFALPVPPADQDSVPSQTPAPRATLNSEASSIQPSPMLAPPFQSTTSASGSLRLEVEPRVGELYVDGFYAGRNEAITNSPAGLRLSAGWHRLEFRAPGYETLAANVTIAAGQANTVRAALRLLQP